MCFARLIPFSALAAVSLTLSLSAQAQSVEPSSTGRGIAGGALLGAEAVLVTEAALNVKPSWMYLVGGTVGAAAGGFGGYFLESTLDAKENMYLLAGGMLLVIPTAVAVLSASAYEPPTDYTQDSAPKDAPAAEAVPVEVKVGPVAPDATPAAPPAAPGTQGSIAPTRRRVASWHSPLQLKPPALLGLESGGLALGVPALEVRNSYTRQEIALFGVGQKPELRVRLLDLQF